MERGTMPGNDERYLSDEGTEFIPVKDYCVWFANR